MKRRVPPGEVSVAGHEKGAHFFLFVGHPRAFVLPLIHTDSSHPVLVFGASHWLAARQPAPLPCARHPAQIPSACLPVLRVPGLGRSTGDRLVVTASRNPGRLTSACWSRPRASC